MPEYDFFFVLKEGNFIHYGCLDVLFHRDGIELLIWLTCPALNFTGNYYERGWTLSVFILWRKWLSECWPQVSNVKVICVAHIFCASPCVKFFFFDCPVYQKFIKKTRSAMLLWDMNYGVMDWMHYVLVIIAGKKLRQCLQKDKRKEFVSCFS